MLVLDSEGRKWEVLPGDPAWNIASGLKRRGYDEVSLPTNAILYGGVPTADDGRIHNLMGHLTSSGTSAEVLDALRPAFLAACTLYDCSKGAYELGLIGEEE